MRTHPLRRFGTAASGLAIMAAAFALSGCFVAHPGYGADDFTRTEDTNGVPTYFAFGSLGDGEKAEVKAAKVIYAACPTGNPILLFGDAMAFSGQDRNGFDRSGKTWMVTFTCNDVIKQPGSP